ncbi:MAG: hypothetical protein H0W14_06730, partial [Actinobacteria bacterium]|nr:hypothetical protein [Actinomycetota bacterium]
MDGIEGLAVGESGARVRLAAEDRAALENELRRAVALYRALGLEVSLKGSEDASNAASVNQGLAYRYMRALGKVRRGLEIEAADCTGSGGSVTP